MKNLFLTIITIISTLSYNNAQTLTVNYSGCEQSSNQFTNNIGNVVNVLQNDLLYTINDYSCDSITFDVTTPSQSTRIKYSDVSFGDANNKPEWLDDLTINTLNDTTYVIINNDGNPYYIKIVNPSVANVDNNKTEISELIAYPNPTVDEITVRFTTNKTDMPITVYSLTGAMVYRNTNTRVIGENRETIQVSNLAQGMYLIRVGDENSEKESNIIKVK
jgi:hypothetical protein